jgi:hypothetical protein
MFVVPSASTGDRQSLFSFTTAHPQAKCQSWFTKCDEEPKLDPVVLGKRAPEQKQDIEE